MGTEILSRRTLSQTSGVVLAYTTLAVFTTNEESVLTRRFDYSKNPSDLLPFPTPAVITTTCLELNRRTLKKDSGLLAYTTLSTFNGEGIPAPRVPLPVLYDIDDAQILTRGGAFIINFTAEPRQGLPPHGVSFTNLSQVPVEVWEWSFGDGETSTEANPDHIYLDNGEYDVTLRCGSNVFGFAHLTRYEYISVGVQVNINPTSGKAPLKVRFSFNETYLN